MSAAKQPNAYYWPEQRYYVETTGDEEVSPRVWALVHALETERDKLAEEVAELKAKIKELTEPSLIEEHYHEHF